jgi:L-aspartate oxidase
LLEAVVFGARAAEDLGGRTWPAAKRPKIATVPAPPRLAAHEQALRHLMTRAVGVQRDAGSLAHALGHIVALERDAPSASLRNLATTALLIAAAAHDRRESRGAHFRRDFPTPDARQARRTMFTLADAHAIAQRACEAEPISVAISK